MAFAVIIFGDLLGYGGAKKDPKDKSLLSGLSTGFGSVSGHMDGTARSTRENGKWREAEGRSKTRVWLLRCSMHGMNCFVAIFTQKADGYAWVGMTAELLPGKIQEKMQNRVRECGRKKKTYAPLL